jgi:ATP-dependent Clp protease ATP-binding subunit ClpB
MTSNHGAELIKEMGPVPIEIQEGIKTFLKTKFRPEFLNRIDEMIVFHKLGMEHVERIFRLSLKKLNLLLKEKGVNLKLTPTAEALVCTAGFDPANGARPLGRAIDQHLKNPLSTALLSSKFKTGDTIIADVSDNNIIFTKDN